jgi:hypothetical protein
MLVACPQPESKIAAPSNFKATALTSLSVNLSWQAVDAAKSYVIDRKNPSGSFQQVAVVSATSWANNQLSPNLEYGYRIRASNGVVLGSPSEITHRTPSAGAVQMVGEAHLLSEALGLDSTLNANAQFRQLPSPIQWLAANPYALVGDRCVVIDQSQSGQETSPLLLGITAGTTLAAGESVVFKDSKNASLELPKTVSGGLVQYQKRSIATFDAGVRLEIPGESGGVSASNVELPALETAAFKFIAPKNLDALKLDEVFTWTAQGQNAVVFFGGIVSFKNGIFFSCAVQDDGNFGFDDQFREAVEKSGGVQGFLVSAYGRVLFSQQASAQNLVFAGYGKSSSELTPPK